MTTRKELIRRYKETKPEAGVFQIKNTRNGKVFIKSTTNLKTMNGQQLQLRMGSHKNKELQQEWNRFGEDAFVFEVLEVLEVKEGETVDNVDLRRLEEKWMNQLQPYDKLGYHVRKEEKE